MQVINSHCSHHRGLDTGRSVTGVIASQHIRAEVCEQRSGTWIQLISIYSQAPRFVHLTFVGLTNFWYMACLLILLRILFHMFCFFVCVYLFYIYLAYVQYFMFSSGFNVIVIKCMVSWITYFSYHNHHHHISNVLVWFPFCELENHSEVDG